MDCNLLITVSDFPGEFSKVFETERKFPTFAYLYVVFPTVAKKRHVCLSIYEEIEFYNMLLPEFYNFFPPIFVSTLPGKLVF